MGDPDLRTTLQAAIEARRDAACAWLTNLIAFPSVQGAEADAQAYILARWQDLGLAAAYAEIPDALASDPEYSHSDHPQPYAGRHNVVARRAGAGGGRSLILQSHSDVIPAGDWAEAFVPRCDGVTITGRGATDAKGQVVTMLLAVAALADAGVTLRGDLECQVVIEEEVGGNGALALIRQGCTADGVIVLEGTGGHVHPANRGAVWFRATTTGRSLHMGRRHEGVNAIEKMVEVIQRMLAYEERLVAESRGQPLFERYANPVQLCLGTIRADGWPSMVADRCVLEGGVGFLPNKTLGEIRQELTEAVLATDDAWLREHFTLEFPKLHNDAYRIPADHPLPVTVSRAAREAGLAAEVFGWNVSCDARLYNRLAGLPTVVFGPSEISQAHAAGESIRVDEMLAGATALALAVARWCGL